MTTTIKRGDTPTLRWRLLSDGKPMDLTGASVKLFIRSAGSPAISRVLTVVNPPTAGQVEHTFDGTLEAGPYDYEIEATRAGVILTAPTNGSAQLLVQADIRED